MRDTGRFKERYDFSLDSRQLGVVLFAALAAAALVFVLGMSVGRQWEKKHAAAAPAAPAAPAGQSGQDEPAGNAEPESMVPAAPAVEPAAATPVPPAAGQKAHDPQGTDKAADAGEGIPPKDLTFPKVLTSKSGKPEPLTKKPEQAKDARHAATTGNTGAYTVQVGAYGDESTANKAAKALSKKGYDASVRQLSTKGGKRLYRVLVGRYDTKDKASAAAKKIESSEKLKPYVTSF